MLTVGSLFSGIGGFDLGLERAGMEIKWQVEIDPFCNKVLAKHWPVIRRYADVKEVHGVAHHAMRVRYGKDNTIQAGRNGIVSADCEQCLPPVDLLCGGPPCQPASVAGKRRGREDDRWLWPETLRLVRELHPRWCLFENPTGILSLDNGIPFEAVLSDLEGQGYAVQSFIIPACAIGAPHRRDRVWIVAHDALRNRHGTNDEISTGWDGAINADCHAADASSAGLSFRGMFGGLSGTAEQSNERQTAIVEHWQEHWYEVAARLCRMDDGIPRRVDRLKSLGNAVVLQIVEILGRAIIEADRD